MPTASIEHAAQVVSNHIGTLAEENEMLKRANQALAAERDALPQERDALATGRNAWERAWNAWAREREALMGNGVILERNKLRAENETLAAHNARLTAHADELAAHNRRLTGRNDELVEQRDRAAAQRDMLMKSGDVVVHARNKLKQENAELERENERLGRENTQWGRDAGRLMELNTAYEAEHYTLTGRYEALKIANASLTARNEELEGLERRSKDAIRELEQTIDLLKVVELELLKRGDANEEKSDSDAASHEDPVLCDEDVVLLAPEEEEEGSRPDPDAETDTIAIKAELRDDSPIRNGIAVSRAAGNNEIIDLTLDTDDEEDEGGAQAYPTKTAAETVRTSSGLPRRPSAATNASATRTNFFSTSAVVRSSLADTANSVKAAQAIPARSAAIATNGYPSQSSRSKPAIQGRDKPSVVVPVSTSTVAPSPPPIMPAPSLAVEPSTAASNRVLIAGTEFNPAQLKEIVKQNGGSEDRSDRVWGKILGQLLRHDVVGPDSFPGQRWQDRIATLRNYYLRHLMHPDDRKMKLQPGKIGERYDAHGASASASTSSSSEPREDGSATSTSGAHATTFRTVSREPLELPARSTSELPTNPNLSLAITHSQHAPLPISIDPRSSQPPASTVEILDTLPAPQKPNEVLAVVNRDSPPADLADRMDQEMPRVKTEELENGDVSSSFHRPLTEAHIRTMWTYRESIIVCNACSCISGARYEVPLITTWKELAAHSEAIHPDYCDVVLKETRGMSDEQVLQWWEELDQP
ncbi:hypothetical protein DFH09DRAFT_396402 [Mycena vulgaris]|nr:hypothetical protein DFH09DRAFT_396402 [Mycena vulgaris]